MKILNIHFKNINSLEGEHRVDFEQAPFTDTGVFAITGPNGAGKSSLLDVITLGLYGETFRFDRPAQHVLTRHTDAGFAVIEFSVGGSQYQSSWHVQRENGQFLPPVMQLKLMPDATLLADSPAQVCAKTTDITGMNFRNFTRSILLAQGDFAAFLSALDSERMDILKKIISTDIYADYKRDIATKADQAQQELQRLQHELAGISLLPPETQEAYAHDLIDFNEHWAELKDEHAQLQQQQALLMDANALKRQANEQEKLLSLTQTQLEQIQQQLGQIHASPDVLSFNDDLERQHDKTHQLHQSKAQLEAMRQELQQLQQQLGDHASTAVTSKLSFAEQQQQLAELQQQSQQLSAASQSESLYVLNLAEQISSQQTALSELSGWLDAHTADAVLLTDFPEIGPLKKLRADLAECLGKHKAFTKQSQKTTTTANNNSSALNAEIQQHKTYQDKLAAHQAALEEMAKGYSVDDLDGLKLEQQERVKDFQSLYKIALRYQQLTENKRFFGLFKTQEPADYDADELSAELEKIRLEIKREENIKRVLEEAIVREGLMKKMAADKVHLVDGRPCPLCGALQHPYVKYPPALTNSKQALIDQKAKLRLLLDKAATTGRKITEAGTQAEKRQAKQQLLQKLRGDWLTLCNRLNAVSEIPDITQLSAMKQRLSQETAATGELANFVARYRSKQQGIAKLNALISKSIAKQAQLQSQTEQLGVNVLGLSAEQQALQDALTQCQQQEQALATTVLEQLTRLGEKMPAKGQEDALIDRLNARRQAYHGYAFKHKNLSEELAALTAKHTASLAEIAQCNTQLETLSSQLQHHEQLTLQLAVIEKQKLIADQERSLAQLEQTLQDLHQRLLAKLQASPYPSQQEVVALLQLHQRLPELQRLHDELAQAQDAHSLALADSNAQWAAATEGLTTPLNATEIGEQIRRLARKIDINRMEAQQRERLLDEQAELQQRHDALLKQWQQQEQAAQPYFADAALLAAEHGMAFRRRVQEHVANKLLLQTNTILEKISGRYYLRQAASDQGLALEVEDTYQNNARRLPKTLSGGESFIISLALALGLSELANNGRSVESLFIDEGFGNLDAESLYTVISTLEGLHTHGKTVGVISHVEAVQKRFKAQLQVVKKANGMGELRKVS